MKLHVFNISQALFYDYAMFTVLENAKFITWKMSNSFKFDNRHENLLVHTSSITIAVL